MMSLCNKVTVVLVVGGVLLYGHELSLHPQVYYRPKVMVSWRFHVLEQLIFV